LEVSAALGTDTVSVQIAAEFVFHELLINSLIPMLNLQATKLFIVTSATKGVVTTPIRISVWFKILYRVI